MNPKPLKLYATIAALIAATLPALQGQVAAQSPTTVANEPKNTKLSEEDLRRGAKESDEVVRLSPFVVPGENAQRYLASETLAGTRVRTSLDDIGSSVSVVTKEFLKDTASFNSQGLLVYTTDTEVGGTGGNFGGLGNGSSLFERSKFVAPNTNTRVRGLAAADNTRNYFTSDVPWDSYNTSSITLSRGANSILFGLGSPAGIINNTTNRAEYRDGNSVEWTTDKYGSHRVAVDLNKVILPSELAIRINALRDRTHYRQEPAYNRDQRLYAALRYEPRFLDKNGSRTSVNVTYEAGSVHSNNPRVLPPVDKITPWFTEMNKATFDGHIPPTLAAQPWLAPEGIGGGPRLIFTSPTETLPSPAYALEITPTTYYGLGATGVVDRSILGLGMPGRPDALKLLRVGAYWNYSLNAKLPFSSSLNPYKDLYITNPSIFNFYDWLIDGPNKAERRRFDVVTADLSQTFWRNKLALQGVWSLEHYDDGFYGVLGWGGPGDTSISVDVNQFLPDGSPNPNVGRPMIESHSGGGTVNLSTRKNSRYTAFADLAASDFVNESWITRTLGRHKFTGAYTIDDYRTQSVTFNRTGMDDAYLLATGGTAPSSLGLPQAGYITYIGADLRGANSASGLNLPNLKAAQSLSVDKTRYWDSHWAKPLNPATPGYVDPSARWVGYDGTNSTQSENPANYTGWTVGNNGVLASDFDNYKATANAAVKNRVNVKSKVFVWQGFLLEGDLVPTWSVRKDTVRTYAKTAPRNANNTYDVDSPNFILSGIPDTNVNSTIHSLSLVAHTPKVLRKSLWKNTDLALTYNDSQNFQVLPGRVDLYGDPVPNPRGKTREYGVLLTTWNNKLRLKVAKYKTELENATLPGAYNEFVLGFSSYLIYTNARRLQLGLSGDPQYSVANSGYTFNLAPFPGTSAADTRAKQQQMVDAALSSLPSDKFFTAWRIDKNKSADWLTPILIDFAAPSGIKATQRSQSEGWEFELDFQPIKNWSLTANASHDTAKYTAVAENFVSFVDHLQKLMEGPVGEMGYTFDYTTPGVNWGRGAPISQQALWNQFFYAPWKLIMAQVGTNLAEIRPWRFNLVTNYRFDQEQLRGWNVGAGYRWEDRVAIGYPVFHDNAKDSDTFDVAHPYWGPRESHVDLWVGYERKLTRRLDWRIQLNVRDLGTKPNLVPISSQPDGTPSARRISFGQSFRLTNTFSF